MQYFCLFVFFAGAIAGFTWLSIRFFFVMCSLFLVPGASSGFFFAGTGQPSLMPAPLPASPVGSQPMVDAHHLFFFFMLLPGRWDLLRGGGLLYFDT
jgi:hypothetical protein